jgi:hypothetical protein
VDTARARFMGAGGTPAERRSSLLHALLPTLDIHTTDSLLAPSSWPTCSHLTSLQLGDALDLCIFPGDPERDVEHLRSALQATSLVALEVVAADNLMLGTLAGVSNLTRLTSLSITSLHTASLDGEAGAQAAASISRLSNLRQLTIRCTHQHHVPQVALGSVGPACWAHLTRLTSLSVTFCCVDLRQLAPLQQLQRLDVRGSPVCAGSLTSLFPLTRLTKLSSGVSPWIPPVYALEPVGGDMPEEVVVPAAWREGLRVLRWGCGDVALTPALLSQLTSLVKLRAYGLVVTPEGCRCVFAFGWC